MQRGQCQCCGAQRGLAAPPPPAAGEAPFRSTRHSCLYPNSKWSLLLLSTYCAPGLTPHLTEFWQKLPKVLMSPFNRDVCLLSPGS